MKPNYLFASLLLSAGALSQESVVVVGYAAKSTTPVSYQNIDRSRLDTLTISEEPSFFLSQTPSVTQYSDAGSYQGYSYIRMRGMDQTRINMTLDGVPLNEPEDQGVYFSNYSGIVGSLQGIQIQRGVGTSHNGTASFAGSIQLHSRDISSGEKTYIDVGRSSFNTWSGAVNYLSGVKDDKGFFVQLAKVQTEGYKYHSGNDSESVFASGIVQDDLGHWQLTGFSGEQANELAWLGVSADDIRRDPRSNGNRNENDHFKQSLVYVARHLQLGEQLNSTTTVYYNRLKGNYDFDLNNFLGLPASDEIYNYAFDSDFSGIFSNLEYAGEHSHLTGGVHLNEYSRIHRGTDQTRIQLYENTGYKNSISGFLKGDYRIGRINFFADIQYRKTSFDYRGSVAMEEMNWSFSSPRAGVDLAVFETLNLYASVGRTAREPTRSDLLGGNENLELNSAGNPNLAIVNPERVTDYELGIRHHHKRFQTDVNLYYMDFANEITLNGQLGPNALPLNQDVDSSTRMGIELLHNLTLSDSLAIGLVASLGKSEVSDQQQTFDPILTPEKIFNISLDYRLHSLACGVSTRYQSKAYLNFANTALLDSYTATTIYASYQVSSTEFRIKVNNLFDRPYFSSGQMDSQGQAKYFVAAPLNISLSVRINIP